MFSARPFYRRISNTKQNQISLVWRSSEEGPKVALDSIWLPKIVCANSWCYVGRAKCATKRLSNPHRFADSPWTWRVLLTDFSALRGHVPSNIDSPPRSSNDRLEPQHFAVSVRHKTLGRPCFFLQNKSQNTREYPQISSWVKKLPSTNLRASVHHETNVITLQQNAACTRGCCKHPILSLQSLSKAPQDSGGFVFRV